VPDRRLLGDWRLFCAAYAALLLFRLTIPLFGFRRIERLFPDRSKPPPRAYMMRVAVAIGVASRLVPGAMCLAQASAGRALFALRGYRVTMRVGVRETGEKQILAHAWLLSGEQVILGSSLDDFQLYRPIADFG
jgi:hypothetical protein